MINYQDWYTGLNRNILECKYIDTMEVQNLDQVLIETYWNVNPEEFKKCAVALMGLNRNILECK